MSGKNGKRKASVAKPGRSSGLPSSKKSPRKRIPSDPVAVFSGPELAPEPSTPLPKFIVELSQAMRLGGLIELNIDGMRLVRAPTASADEAAQAAARAEADAKGIALVSAITNANASVTDEQLLLDPMAGLRGALSFQEH